jgi:hypothetical protein
MPTEELTGTPDLLRDAAPQATAAEIISSPVYKCENRYM